MTHLADGPLRRSLDEPESMGDAERAHLRGCGRCRGALAAAAADRDAAAGLLHTVVAGAPDTDAGWGRLADRLHGPAAGRPVEGPAARPPAAAPRGGAARAGAGRLRLRRPVVAAATVAVLAIGSAAAAAAADWLPVFQPREVTAVSLDLSDVQALPDLSAYGTASGVDVSEPRRVAGAAEAAAGSGIPVPRVGDLPQGVSGSPTWAVLPNGTGRFTFSAEKARAAAARTGRSLPAMPAGVDGSVLEVQAGPGVVASWGGSEGGFPELAVVRMVAPRASAQGVSLATLRDYLLAQPGIPAGTAAQLRALPDDGSVLPVPVPSRYADSRATTVHGVPATALELRDGSGAAVLWIEGGRLNAVLGLVGLDEIEAVARDLR